MNLHELIASQKRQQITEFLDALSPEQRLIETRSLNRAQQRQLYNLSADNPELSLEDFVPLNTPERTEVIHSGRNTLPLLERSSFLRNDFAEPAKLECSLATITGSPPH